MGRLVNSKDGDVNFENPNMSLDNLLEYGIPGRGAGERQARAARGLLPRRRRAGRRRRLLHAREDQGRVSSRPRGAPPLGNEETLTSRPKNYLKIIYCGPSRRPAGVSWGGAPIL